MTTQRYFKVLDADGRSRNGGEHQWSLPDDGEPGEWTSERGVVPCKSGCHLCASGMHLLEWLGPRIWVAEVSGEVVHHMGDKVVAPRCRLIAPTAWDDRSARLFAADCAEHVLPVFEAERPDDLRPREAIAAARAFARGEIDAEAMGKARDAAHAAAYITVGAAAGAAARAAASTAVSDAAYAAADAAASDATYHEGWAAPDFDTERAWQADRLMQYVRGELK